MQRICNKSPSLLCVNAKRLMKYSLLAVALATPSMAQDVFLGKEADAQVADGKISVQLEEGHDEAMKNEMSVISRSRRSLLDGDAGDNPGDPSCIYETDPAAPVITLQFKPGEEVKLEDEFHKAFKYIHGSIDGKVDVVNCPVTHIYKYNTPAGPMRDGDDNEIPVAPVLLADETITIPNEPSAKPSQMFFSIGSAVAKSANVIGATITTCGYEEITVVDDAPYVLALTKYGQNKLFVLHDTVFEGWFKEDFAGPSDDKPGNEKCVIDKYELVDETGATLVSDLAEMSPYYNDYIHQDLLVNIENDVAAPVTVYLQAKTLGQKVAKRAVSITVDTSKNIDDGPCQYSVTPAQADSATKFESGKDLVINLANVFKERFSLATSNLETCKIDQVEVFTGVLEDPEQGPTYINDFVEKNFNDFTFTAKQPGKQTYYFRVSSSSSSALPSNVVESDVTVCGNEVIVATDGKEALSFEGDGAQTVEVPTADYSTWFTLTHDEDSSPLCGIEKFEIVEQKDQDFVPLEKVDKYAIAQKALWLESPIEIDLRQDQKDFNNLYLQATTMGNQVARKQLSISVTAFKCGDLYSVANNDATVVVPYQKSQEIEVYDALNTEMQFATADEENCPIDQLTIFADSSAYPDTPLSRTSLAWATLEMESKTKGLNKYYMSIGSKNNDFKSKLYTGTIIVCGLEQIEAVSEDSEVISVEKDGPENTQKIEPSTYKNWFKTETGDQSSTACLDITYKLVQQRSVVGYNDVVDDPIVNMVGDTISITRALTTVLPYELYLQATTKGEQVARKLLSVSTPCAYASEAVTDAPKPVLPFVSGQKVDTYDYLKEQWKFTTNDIESSNANCPIENVYTYASEADYEAGTILQQGGEDAIDFNMDDSNKGKNQIFFSIGGDAAAAKKNFATGTIIICGKETLAQGIPGAHKVVVKKDAGAPGLTKIIEADDIASWFKIDNTGEDTGAACVVNSYELVNSGDDSGEAITGDAMVSYDGDKITISIDDTTIELRSVFMKAITNGGVSAYKELSIAQTSDPCIYSITPESGSTVFAYTEGQQVEVGGQLKGLFTFSSGDGCDVPEDQIYTYASETDHPDTVAASGDFASLDFTMSEDTKGRNKYSFAIGAIGKEQKSGLASAEIIICGKETLELTDAEALQVDFTKGQTDPRTFKLADYQEWFKLVEGADSSPECTINKYGLYKDASAGDEVTGDDIASFGTNQITLNNPVTGTSTFYFQAQTKGGVTIRRQIDVFQIPESRVLTEKLAVAPSWDGYDASNKFTQALKQWWDTPTLAGGPLTEPLSTPTRSGITTPLQGLIDSTPSFGYFEIRKLQLSASASSQYWFYDVDILATKEEDVETLQQLSENPSQKCCWWNEKQNNINGFGRVVFYREKNGDGSEPEYSYYIWEGQLEKGLPKGFARYIQPTRLFVGYLENLGYTQAGTALFFNDFALQDSAFYEEGTRFRQDSPGDEKQSEFMEFTQTG